ncbi:hypothetical protein H8959_006865 [Pygathrix nigripes]
MARPVTRATLGNAVGLGRAASPFRRKSVRAAPQLASPEPDMEPGLGQLRRPGPPEAGPSRQPGRLGSLCPPGRTGAAGEKLPSGILLNSRASRTGVLHPVLPAFSFLPSACTDPGLLVVRSGSVAPQHPFSFPKVYPFLCSKWVPLPHSCAFRGHQPSMGRSVSRCGRSMGAIQWQPCCSTQVCLFPTRIGAHTTDLTYGHPRVEFCLLQVASLTQNLCSHSAPCTRCMGVQTQGAQWLLRGTQPQVLFPRLPTFQSPALPRKY